MKTIITVGQLRKELEKFSDKDLIVMETIDLKTGDAEDLYPFHIDIIDNILLDDGTTVKEVRLCQEANL